MIKIRPEYLEALRTVPHRAIEPADIVFVTEETLKLLSLVRDLQARVEKLRRSQSMARAVLGRIEDLRLAWALTPEAWQEEKFAPLLQAFTELWKAMEQLRREET